MAIPSMLTELHGDLKAECSGRSPVQLIKPALSEGKGLIAISYVGHIFAEQRNIQVPRIEVQIDAGVEEAVCPLGHLAGKHRMARKVDGTLPIVIELDGNITDAGRP